MKSTLIATLSVATIMFVSTALAGTKTFSIKNDHSLANKMKVTCTKDSYTASVTIDYNSTKNLSVNDTKFPITCKAKKDNDFDTGTKATFTLYNSTSTSTTIKLNDHHSGAGAYGAPGTTHNE